MKGKAPLLWAIGLFLISCVSGIIVAINDTGEKQVKKINPSPSYSREDSITLTPEWQIVRLQGKRVIYVAEPDGGIWELETPKGKKFRFVEGVEGVVDIGNPNHILVRGITATKLRVIEP